MYHLPLVTYCTAPSHRPIGTTSGSSKVDTLLWASTTRVPFSHSESLSVQLLSDSESQSVSRTPAAALTQHDNAKGPSSPRSLATSLALCSKVLSGVVPVSQTAKGPHVVIGTRVVFVTGDDLWHHLANDVNTVATSFHQALRGNRSAMVM